MNRKWKALWGSLEKRDYFIPKLVVSMFLVGLAFRLLHANSTGFSDVADISFINQTVNLSPTVSGDLPDNRDPTPGNSSQVPVDKSPPISFDFDENTDRIPRNDTESQVSGSGDRFRENGTQIPANPPPPFTVNFTESGNQIPKKEMCDIFSGDWIPNPAGPLYTNESCPLITAHQNCMKNGRPDTGFLYWRWSPRDCELLPFDAQQFLEIMRNKTWALIGDSLTRNHVESLLCILSKVDQAVEVYHDEEWRSKRWHFASYNFTLSVIWAPFLAKASIFEDYNGISSAPIELHLDKLDPTWSEQYQSLDYMMFSSGEWFVKTAIYYENNTILGSHNVPDKNYTDIGFDLAYRKVLQNLFNFIVTSNHKGMIFYRTSTPDHFENGEWYNGGNCQRTEPVKEGEFNVNGLNKILRAVELEEFEKAATKASEKGVSLRLLDVSPLSLLRPDGHPGLYRYFHPLSMDNTTKIYYDCLHWCLPGPIDSWNDLLMEMVVNG